MLRRKNVSTCRLCCVPVSARQKSYRRQCPESVAQCSHNRNRIGDSARTRAAGASCSQAIATQASVEKTAVQPAKLCRARLLGIGGGLISMEPHRRGSPRKVACVREFCREHKQGAQSETRGLIVGSGLPWTVGTCLWRGVFAIPAKPATVDIADGKLREAIQCRDRENGLRSIGSAP